jgi:nitroreductase
MSYETLLEITEKRRSIRKFTDKPVSRDDIEKIVQIGLQAPCGFNAQMWEMVVVDDLGMRDEIAECLLDITRNAKTAKGFAAAPVFLLLYGDERVRQYGPPPKSDDKWWEFTLNASLGSAFMNMQLAATSLGLGSMWVSSGRSPKAQEKVSELLNLPPYLKLYELLAIGYPDMKPGKKKLRELSDVIHYNGAENYRSDDQIKKWFLPE